MPVLVLLDGDNIYKALPQNGIIVMGNEQTVYLQQLKRTSTIVFPYRVLG
jgi:hypothetical protein